MIELGIFLGAMIGLIVLGAPVVLAICVADIALIAYMGLDPIVLAQKLFFGINNFAFLAVPLYIFVGEVMWRGGIAQRLIDFADALIGKVPGSLGHVNVLTSMFMGGVSGSAMADAATTSSMLIKPMVRHKFPAPYSAAITASSSIIGIIIPPSIPFLLYAIITQPSVLGMFLGGVLPGIGVGLALMVTVYLTSKANNYGSHEGRTFSPALAWNTFVKASPAFVIPLIIVGGLLGGVFTATEAGAFAAIVAFLLAWLGYRRVRFRDIPTLLLSTARITSSVMLIVGAASAASWLLSRAGATQMLVEVVRDASGNGFLAILSINLFLIVVGMVMDLSPALIIFAPLLLPIALEFGVDPIQFGVMLVLNLGIGLITMPVGQVLYVVSSVSGVSIPQLVKAMLPFYLALIAMLGLVAAVPFLTTYIPSILQ